MPRPDQSPKRRREFLPIVAETFAELGYRRATTAELAARCAVRENVLYRLWPDKQAMFVASLDYVYTVSEEAWGKLLADTEGSGPSAAERILEYESKHHGEHGLYRIVFAGLSETDDEDIAAGLKRLFGRFQRFVRKQVAAHRSEAEQLSSADDASVAWAIVGLGTVSNIGRELGLLSGPARKRLMSSVGQVLLGQR